MSETFERPCWGGPCTQKGRDTPGFCKCKSDADALTASLSREAALVEALEPFAKAFGEVTMWAVPGLPFDEKSKGYAHTGLINSVSFNDFQRAAIALRNKPAA